MAGGSMDADGFAPLEIVDGGRCVHGPRLVAVDIDHVPWLALEPAFVPSVPFVSKDEERALLEAREVVELVLLSKARHVLAIREIPNTLHSFPLVGTIKNEMLECAESPAAALAGDLAGYCMERGLSFSEVAVIAAHPGAGEAMLEAGWALALQDAGASVCSVADMVFPPREQGGLAAAIEAAVRMARCVRAAGADS